MLDYDAMKERFAASKFRSRFRLTAADRGYLAEKGWEAVRGQALRIIGERLAPAEPLNDGRQTPMRGHVVFLAQHATATCCRGCLAKWHGIPAGRPLTAGEAEQVADMIVGWLKDKAGDLSAIPRTPELFGEDPADPDR